MKNRLKHCFMAVTACMVFILTACTSSDAGYAIADNSREYGMTTKMAADSYAPAAINEESFSYEDYDNNTRSEADIIGNSAMIAKEADISIDVGKLERAASTICEQCEVAGGWVEEKTINSYDGDYSSDRYGSLAMRVS